jgi:hypothetical protein
MHYGISVLSRLKGHAKTVQEIAIIISWQCPVNLLIPDAPAALNSVLPPKAHQSDADSSGSMREAPQPIDVMQRER